MRVVQGIGLSVTLSLLERRDMTEEREMQGSNGERESNDDDRDKKYAQTPMLETPRAPLDSKDGMKIR